MTDPGVHLGEILVMGQVRQANGQFPPGGGGSGGGAGEPGEEMNTDEGVGPPQPDPADPCADALSAQERDIDAAAAAASREFDRLGRAAGENGINDRERAAFLFRRPDGTIGFGPIPIAQSGLFSEGGEAVLPSLGDIDPSTVVGFIHSHSQGQHVPSGPSPRAGLEGGDIGFFNNYLVPLMSGSAVTPRMYVAAQNQLGPGQTPYNQINKYNASNIDSAIATSTAGPEVNPDGVPCPR